MFFWQYFSLIGSLAVTGPIGIAIAVWLLVGKSWRLSLSWCLLFCGGMALVVLTKMAFYGWGVGVESVDFAGFSGHSMRSGAVYPVAFFLAFRNVRGAARYWALAGGVLLAVLIAMSRVVVHAHSVSEAVTGCLLGLLVAGLFVWHVSTEGHLVVSRVLVALCMPLLLVTPQHGESELFYAEGWIARLALLLSGHDRPFTRQQWRQPKPSAASPVSTSHAGSGYGLI
jgi:membrane-associated phospholipid phosphatase